MQKILGEAVGIQFTGTTDNTGTNPILQATTALIVGIFRRGRTDKPMRITSKNIRSELGYDPDNPAYQAVQDTLDMGVPFAWVMRVAASNSGGGVVPPPVGQISCDGATQEAVLKHVIYFFGGPDESYPIYDIYVNGVFITTSESLVTFSTNWSDINALATNANELQYNVYGNSNGDTIFYNSSSSNITFKIVPKINGFYEAFEDTDGIVYAKDYLKISDSNTNPTVYKDPATGEITFCLVGNVPNSVYISTKWGILITNKFQANLNINNNDLGRVTFSSYEVTSADPATQIYLDSVLRVYGNSSGGIYISAKDGSGVLDIILENFLASWDVEDQYQEFTYPENMDSYISGNGINRLWFKIKGND